MVVPLPSAESLAHRARIAEVIRSLRPTRLRTSVVDLIAHRRPTLWTLYRSLLRDAPSMPIRTLVQDTFRKTKNLRKASHVRDALEQGHRWAEVFAKAKCGDNYCQTVLERYTRILLHRSQKARWMEMIREDIAWRKKLANRAILTGAYLRPSLSNPPLPRLHRQPSHISGMIAKRRKVRQRRGDRFGVLVGLQEDILHEMKFEEELSRRATRDGHRIDPAYEDRDAWVDPFTHEFVQIKRSYERDNIRASMPYTPEMLEQIKQARREKIANKTRELERERRGVDTPRALERKRKGPPAHVLAAMTPLQRHMDAVSRSLSEVGYVAKVKRALGVKFKNTDAWKVELGRPENKEELDRMEEEVRAENERRRAASESSRDSESEPAGQ